MRSLTTPSRYLCNVVRDDKFRRTQGSGAGRHKFPLKEADFSPLPPTILPARGFEMTKGCDSEEAGPGGINDLWLLHD